VYGLSDEQIEMFDNRFVSNINTIPDDAIILCYTNDDVKKFNKEKIELSDGELIECIAVDNSYGQGKDSNACRNALADLKTKTDLNDTACLPTKILFKLNCKYMITTNMKLNDGLVNGAVGVLKAFIRDDKADRPVVKRVYLDFGDADVGRLTRNNADTLRKMRKDNIRANWTCIEWDQQTIKKGTTYKIDRFQFPLTEAEAITIHKSQGQTYQKVAVNLNGVVQRALLYVALSRVTTLDGLYIFNSNPTGQKSIVSDRIRGLTRDKRNEKIDEDERCNSVRKEMRRLRTQCQMKNEYNFLDETFVQDSNSLSIMALNVRAFNSNKFNLRSDRAFMNSDLILLTECHNQVQYRQQAVDLLSQQGFRLVHYSWCSRPHASNGQIAYVRIGRHSERLRFMCDNSVDNTREYREKHKIVEMSLFEYKCNDLSEPMMRTNRTYNTLYIVSLYKHADMSKRECVKQLKDFLQRHLRLFDDQDEDEQDFLMAARRRNASRIKNVLVVGDFNIDFNKEHECMNRMRNELNLNPMSVNECTYRRNRETTGSHLDWAFTSNDFNFGIDRRSDIYENWYSDHSALWIHFKLI